MNGEEDEEDEEEYGGWEARVERYVLLGIECLNNHK